MLNLLSRFFCIYFCCLSLSFASEFTTSTFDGALQELLHEKLSDDSLILEIIPESKAKLEKLRQSYDDVDNIQMIQFSPQSNSFRVKIHMKNGEAQEFFGRYSAYVEIPVLNKQVNYGEVITESDVMNIRSKIHKIKSGYVKSSENLIGMQAKKSLLAGVQIKETDITKPFVVHENDLVMMVYQNDHLKLKTNGIAMASGAIDEVIKLKNSTTGTIVYGRIKAPNLVQVDSE